MDSDRTVDTHRTELELQETSKRQRFTKADRLLERAQFVHLAKHGKKIQNRHFIAYYEPGEHQRCRIGITVSKKVGNAATRNRIKRLVREYYRKKHPPFGHYWDIHLIAKRELADQRTQNVLISLEKLFNRIELFKDE